MNSYQKRLAYHDRVAGSVEWSHWFIFFNVFVSVVIALRYLFNASLPETPMGVVYEAVNVIGHFWFLNFVIFLLALFPLSFAIPRPGLFRCAATALLVVAQTLLLIDTQVFHVFRFHLNPQLFRIFTDNSNYHSGMNFNYLLIVFPLLVAVEILLGRYAVYKADKHRKNWIARSFLIFFLACFASTHLLHIWADYSEYEPITDQEATLPLSYPLTAKSFLSRNDWLVLPQAEKQADRAPSLYYPLSAIKVDPKKAKGYSYLLIGVRDWSYRQTDRESMEYVTSLRERAADFTAHYANDTDFDNACFSLFYGLSPQYRPAVNRSELTPVFIDELQRQSYSINRLISDPAGNSARGESIFRGLRSADASSFVKSDAQAEGLAREFIAAKWNRNVKNMLFVSLSAPASAHGADQARRTGRGVTKLAEGYRHSLKVTDQRIKRIVETLESTGEAENTVVMIVGLNGYALPDTAEERQNAGQLAYDRLQVPLLIIHPDVSPRKIEYLTSHADISPTALSLDFGVKNPISEFSNGNSLLSSDHDRFVIIGNAGKVGVMEDRQITLFSRKGTYRVTDSRKGSSRTESEITIETLIRATRQLHKFLRN